MSKRIKQNRQSGSTLLETLFYISFFTVLSLAVINALITMAGSLGETAIQAQFTESSNIMEKIGREIRQAKSANLVSASDLQLQTTDSSGSSKTEEFLLTGGNVQFLENGTVTGNINAGDVSVTNLAFVLITTAKGIAVKISLTVKSQHDALARTQDFYDTVALRGNYGS